MNVAHLLTRAASRYPNRPAWLQGDCTVTYRVAESRVNQLSHGLIALGARQGDRIAMLLVNSFEGFETILAPMKAGMAVVPLNIRCHPAEHVYVVNDSGATVLIYGAQFRSEIDTIRKELTSVKRFISVGAESHDDPNYDVILAEQPNTVPQCSIDPDDLAWLFYTSGTSGRPKGAMLTHRNLLTMTQQFLLDLNPVRETDVLLHAAAITHGSGLTLLPHIARGAANALGTTRSFDAPGIFEAIERHRTTTMFLAPTMINALVRHPERARHDLSSLHTIFYGGGPMHVRHLLDAVEAFGPIFVQLFGQGEAPMTCTCLPKEEHVVGEDRTRLQRLASAGRETTAVQLRIVNEADQEVPHGHSGEIVVRSDLVMKGYWDQPEATAEAIRGGWLHTGDIGYRDEDGYVYITDRKKEMIISGGYNVYCREVEDVICAHPAVVEAAVVGVPDDKWGEVVKAFVVAHPEAALSAVDIIDHCRRALASYKKPQSVEFVLGLPKNAYGKILKRELARPYWAGRTRAI